MKEIIKTDLPVSVPISHAVRAGDFIFVSGQISTDLKTNQIVRGGIEKETSVVLERIEHILNDAGCSLQDVVKATVLLTNINDFDGMNTVFKTYFPVDPPARLCFEVKLAADVAVEIEVIAYAPIK
jgi:reactive intermediate/imine deaminase